MESGEWIAIGFYAVAWAAGLLWRALRWGVLLRPFSSIASREVLGVSLLGFAGMIILPFRSGELVRPALIARQTSVSAWAAATTVAVERVLDGVVVSALLLLGITIAVPTDLPPVEIAGVSIPLRLFATGARVSLIGFLGLLTSLALLHLRREWFERILRRTLAVFSERLSSFVGDRAAVVGDALQAVSSRRSIALPLILTIGYWAFSVGALVVLLDAFGFEAGFFEAMVVMGVLALGVMVPQAPGYYGTFQLSAYAGLFLCFSPELVRSAGAPFVFFLYAVQVGLTLLGGLSALVGPAVVARWMGRPSLLPSISSEAEVGHALAGTSQPLDRQKLG